MNVSVLRRDEDIKHFDYPSRVIEHFSVGELEVNVDIIWRWNVTGELSLKQNRVWPLTITVGTVRSERRRCAICEGNLDWWEIWIFKVRRRKVLDRETTRPELIVELITFVNPVQWVRFDEPYLNSVLIFKCFAVLDVKVLLTLTNDLLVVQLDTSCLEVIGKVDYCTKLPALKV